MGNLRPVLAIGLVFLAYMLWVEWQKDYGPKPLPAQASPASESSGRSVPSVPGEHVADLPEPVEAGPAAQQKTGQQGLPTMETPVEMAGESPLVTVTTDVLEVEIDLLGGTVVSSRLLDYPVVLDEPDIKINLLSRYGDDMFIAQSGLLSHQSAPNHTSQYASDRMEYVLAEGAQEIRIPLTWESEEGVRVTKTFVLQRGRYDITVRHQLENRSAETWSGSRYSQLQRSVPANDDDGGFTNPGRYSFNGIAEDEEASYSTQELKGNGWPRYIAREVSPQQQAAPNGRTEFSSRLYLGPKLQDQLADVAPGLGYTVNYGIFTVISKPLYWLLSHIHSLVGNWGWAIVLLTIVIKAAFFKLTEAQYKSMARMRKLQPRIDQLKERYGDDRQRMSQAMMEMYKKEKVNPLGGCLPIVVQIPVFIALYWVLLESVELRQAPFILWIDNLSVRDPYFILPLLNAGFMFATQRLTPMAGMDPLQRKMMSMMPLVFSVMFAFFPAGLVLYWATNAGLSLAQQYYITRKIAAADH